MMEADNTEDKNWSIKWMQKAEVLNCVFNRMKELQNGAEPKSEEDTLMWIIDMTQNYMIGHTKEELIEMWGTIECANGSFCPFYKAEEKI